jgi:hypothetical protein
MVLALGIARGMLHSVAIGDLDGLEEILDHTATMNIAKALGLKEEDLSVDYTDHLTQEEANRIKGWG